MRVTNRSKSPVAFRDDAGKHILKPRQSLEVMGDQHLPHILSLAGISATTVSGHRPARSVAPEPSVEAVEPFRDDFEEADE